MVINYETSYKICHIFACDLGACLVIMLPTMLVTYCVCMCHQWTLGTVSITHLVLTIHMPCVYIEILKILLSCMSYLTFRQGFRLNFWNIIVSNIIKIKISISLSLWDSSLIILYRNRWRHCEWNGWNTMERVIIHVQGEQ